MAVTIDHPAPYAPASAILSLIERHRNKGLPTPVDGDVLARAGVSPSLIPRTLQALQTLDLIDAEGKPTPVFEGIRLAPESEYQTRLHEWLTAAYADALAYVDPATADEVAIRDAFRKYTPTGQQGRMVSLFMGLFTAAGVMPERQRQSVSRKQSNGAPTAKSRLVYKSPPKPRDQHYGGGGAAGKAPAGLPPALTGLLESLPRSGEGWTKERRDAFLSTFGAVLDFCFPIGERVAQTDEEKEISG